MTIAIVAKSSEGISIATDSILSNIDTGVSFRGGQKIYFPGNLDSIGNHIHLAFAVYGDALLNGHSYRELSAKVENMLKIQKKYTVLSVTNKIIKIIKDEFNVTKAKGGIIVAGYDTGKYVPRIISINLENLKKQEIYKNENTGIVFGGQPATIERALYGVDQITLISSVTSSIYKGYKEVASNNPEIFTDKINKGFIEPFLKEIIECSVAKNNVEELVEKNYFDYSWLPKNFLKEFKDHTKHIKHGLVQVQDYTTTVTIPPELPIRELAKLTSGLVLGGTHLAYFAGATQTVGGFCDIALISPDRGFRFVKHKKLDSF